MQVVSLCKKTAGKSHGPNILYCTLSSFDSNFSFTSTDSEGLVSVSGVSGAGVGVGAVGVVTGGVLDSACLESVDG